MRYDHFSSYFPEQTLGPAPLTPTRNITFPRTPMASWSDIVPRLGSAYDLFGDGKTALKVSINKYVIAQGLQGTYGDTANPVNRLANIVTRTWTDQNRNFVPDCDLTNVLAQDQRAAGGDLCGVVSDTNFGKLDGEPQLRPGGVERLGDAAVPVGVLGERAAAARRTTCRSISGTSAAGTATSASRTTST